MKPLARLIWPIAVFASLLVASCSGDRKGDGYKTAHSIFSDDNISPVPGKRINVTQKTPGTMTVSWDAATDDETPQNSLQYKLVYSTGNNINTVRNAEKNGRVVMGWTPGTLSRQVNGLAADNDYYFTVLVRDGGGNMAVYIPGSLSSQDKNPSFAKGQTFPGNGDGGTTEYQTQRPSSSDASPPSVGSNLSVAEVTSDSITVSWDEAGDDVTQPEKLQYKVVYSTEKDIDNIKDAESNGQVALGWTSGAYTCTISSLEPSTTYYIVTMVRDEAGNTAFYDVCEAATAAAQGKDG